MGKEKIAIVAGKGKLPLIWINKAKKKKKELYVLSLFESNKSALGKDVKKVYSINLGQLGKIINLLYENNIKKVIVLGKIEKTDIFKHFNPDQEMNQLLNGLDKMGDDCILTALGNYFEKKGIKVLEQSTYLNSLLPGSGLFTSKQPSNALVADLKYGFKIAQEIGKLDIGQTVIVKKKVVLAVEAIEGTDAAIKRGGRLGQKGVIMAKVSKPQQDFRFDIPAVGMKTINNLIEVKARGLVFEANKTFIIEKEKVFETADNTNITIMGLTGDQ